MKFTISCLLTLPMLHTKFGKDWPSSSWEEDVNGRCTRHTAQHTTDNVGPQPTAIGHLSDSGDLKSYMVQIYFVWETEQEMEVKENTSC